MYGTVGLVCSVVCIGLGTFLVARLGARLSTVVSYAGYGLMALVYLLAPEIAKIGYIFVILSIYWNMTDTLTIAMQQSAAHCASPTSASPRPSSPSTIRWPICRCRWVATIYAVVAGYGNVVAMPVIIGMIVISCAGYQMMRIGGRTEHLDVLEPRVD